MTVNGQPLPYGEIVFTPDASKGITGSGAVANIENGAFKTPSRLGTLAGSHVVLITGSDSANRSAAPPPGTPAPKVLVKDYKEAVVFPAAASRHEFNISVGKK